MKISNHYQLYNLVLSNLITTNLYDVTKSVCAFSYTLLTILLTIYYFINYCSFIYILIMYDVCGDTYNDTALIIALQH